MMTSDNDASFLASLNAEQRLAAEHSVKGRFRHCRRRHGQDQNAGRSRRQLHSITGPIQARSCCSHSPGTGRGNDSQGRASGRRGASGRGLGGTFHAWRPSSLAAYITRHWASIPTSSSWIRVTPGLLHLIRTDLELHQSETRFPQKGTLLAIYSRVVNTGVSSAQAIEDHFPWCEAAWPPSKRSFRDSPRAKPRRHLLDYDDLLLYWDQALASASVGPFSQTDSPTCSSTNTRTPMRPPGLHSAKRSWNLIGRPGRIRHRPIPPKIRSWSSATTPRRFIRSAAAPSSKFSASTRSFPDTTTACLEQNYRSIRPILHSFQRRHGVGSERFTKNLWSERTGEQEAQPDHL